MASTDVKSKQTQNLTGWLFHAALCKDFKVTRCHRDLGHDGGWTEEDITSDQMKRAVILFVISDDFLR